MALSALLVLPATSAGAAQSDEDGGGGGGGYFGGGGGSTDLFDYNYGAGGGAGSSFAVSTATNVTYADDTTGTPEVVITAMGSPSTFTYTGSEQTYTVPTGVTSVTIQAKGGAGANNACGPGGVDGYGGYGASVTATIPVTAGETLYVDAGTSASGATGGYTGVSTHQTGGNAGTYACAGGGGGGYGTVLTCSITLTTCTAGFGTAKDPRLVAAGGGGGAGSDDGCSGGNAGSNGVGGAGGSGLYGSCNGGGGGGNGTGSAGENTGDDIGGGGATQAAVGQGGIGDSGDNGAPGSADIGGNGYSASASATTTTTTSATASTAVGGGMTDTATLSGGNSPTGTVTFSLYGPSATASCSGTPVFTSTKTVSGNGSYTSDAYTPTAPGTYYWVASYSGDAGNAASSTACGDSGESTTVSKATTTVTTTATSTAMVGGSISDSATLAGGYKPSGSIVFSLYGPSATASCTGTPIFTSTKTVNGNGQYTSDAYTPTAPGTYYWVASYSGDAGNAASSTACGDTGESTNVTKATTKVMTTATVTVTVGATISDSATLSGGYKPTGTITFSLYGPSATVSCTGTPVFTSTKTVNGNGQYASDAYTTAAAGTYYWVASYSGDANNTAATTACGDSGESTIVNKASPTVTTTATSTATIGSTISDSGTLSGGYKPTGSIVFSLYGSNDATCAQTPVYTSTLPVNGNGTYQSGSYLVLTPGTYHWIARYSGDSNNNPAATKCNDPGESTTVAGFAPSTARTIVTAANSYTSCTISQGITLSLSANASSTGTPYGTFSERDAVHGIALSNVQIRSVQRTGSGPVHSGNSAVLVGQGQQNGVAVNVRIDVHDVSSARCVDTVQVQTSAGYNSGVLSVASASVSPM